MELTILKIVGCSAVLIAFYYLFLGRERTFKFNRMFLLISLVFAYIVPFIQFENPFKGNSKANLIFGEATASLEKINLTNQESFDFGIILLWIYGAISVFLLIKLIFSLFKILLIKGEKRVYKNHKLLIMEEEIIPFSFLNTIYISRNNFLNNEIDERIFLHEKCHIEEKHSLDILFLEFLKIFSWINPALYFYKKAMISNHEFLADDYVLKNNFNISNYQHLILNEIKYSQSFKLTHQFNFNNTKKRFIMMTSKNSKLVGMKKILLLPILAILFVSFTKEKENETVSNSPETLVKQNVSVVENSTPELKNIPENFEYTSLKSIVKNDTIRKEKKMRAENSQSIPPPPPPPPSEVEQIPAEFPGGVNKLRSEVANAFDTSIFNGNEGLVKTSVYISIDEKGNVTNIASEGDYTKFNEEAVRVFKISNSGKIWKPAVEDGKAVATVFRVPLTMYFAGPAENK